MWILATWDEIRVIPDPSEQQIVEAVLMLDNQQNTGVSLYHPAPDSDGRDERVVICGGERVIAEYWPAYADHPSHMLQDFHASTQQTVIIHFGSQGALEFPAWQTVLRETALQAVLDFFHSGRIGGSPWVRCEE